MTGRRDQRITWSITGAAVGAILGLLIGNVGVASGGGAVGVDWWLFILIGGVIGFGAASLWRSGRS